MIVVLRPEERTSGRCTRRTSASRTVPTSARCRRSCCPRPVELKGGGGVDTWRCTVRWIRRASRRNVACKCTLHLCLRGGSPGCVHATRLAVRTSRCGSESPDAGAARVGVADEGVPGATCRCTSTTTTASATSSTGCRSSTRGRRQSAKRERGDRWGLETRLQRALRPRLLALSQVFTCASRPSVLSQDGRRLWLLRFPTFFHPFPSLYGQ